MWSWSSVYSRRPPPLAGPLAAERLAHTDAEVAAIVSHLRRLPTIHWRQVRVGQEVYDGLCVYCHGIYGRGDGMMAESLPSRPRDLSSPVYQQQVSDAELLRTIAEGKGAMPGAAEVVSAEELEAVVVFVRLLSPGFELYERFCAACHGSDGLPPVPALEGMGDLEDTEDGRPKVPLNQAYWRTHSDEEVRGKVQFMLRWSRDVMPHFIGALAVEEVRQILDYLRALASQP